MFSKIIKKIGKCIKNLIRDIKDKKLTPRVELLFGCAAVIILCAIVSVSAIGCGKKNTKNTEQAVDAALSVKAGLTGNAAGNDDALSINELDKDYDKDANVVDEEKYKDTVLGESEDAGEGYIKDTLFIGDSNTVRMMNLGYTTLDNTLAVVGMGIQSVKSLKCVEFSGYSSPVTMVEAVKLMQPKRIIITFGTNNANGMDVETFIKRYNEALDAITEAYPYADILINSVPPFAKKNSYPKLSITSIDKFNVALNDLAKERDLKFINSSSVMKDESTGYAKAGYMAGDGIHITKEGFDAMFKYIRTHSYETDDRRPKPLKTVPKQVRATYVIGGDGKMRDDKASYEQMSVDPDIPVVTDVPSVISSTVPADTHVHQYDGGTVVKQPSYDEEGRKEYRCSCGATYTESIPKTERPKQEPKPAPAPVPDPPPAPPVNSSTEQVSNPMPGESEPPSTTEQVTDPNTTTDPEPMPAPEPEPEPEPVPVPESNPEPELEPPLED